MVKHIPYTILVAAACGGGPRPEPTTAAKAPPARTAAEDCKTLVDKSAPVVRAMVEAAGKVFDPGMLDKLDAQCRDGKGKDRVMLDCVIAAADQPAVATCWQAAMQDYADAGKRIEADVMLRRIGKNAKVYYVHNAQFPVGTGPLTPDCCAAPGHRCQPEAPVWTGLWQELEIEAYDAIRFRYEITSTADRLVARAHGDLDCDGKFVVTTLTATVDGNGNPRVEITTSGED